MAKKLFTQQPQMAWQEFAKIDSVLSDEQQNLRSFIKELSGDRPTKLIDDVMEMAVLEKLVKRLESQWNVRIEFEVEQEASSAPTRVVEHLLYMIQEGVSNAVHHGHASIVQIKIGRNGKNLTMSITDNGTGFSFQDGVERTANEAGPRMLRSRIASLGGSVSIRSSDSGACVEIILPLSQIGDSHADQSSSRR